MKKEVIRTIICMALGFLMIFLLFTCGCQIDHKTETSLRIMGDGEEAAQWRQPGVFGNLGR